MVVMALFVADVIQLFIYNFCLIAKFLLVADVIANFLLLYQML